MTYKNNYNNSIVMLKIGNFYEIYAIDAYILSNIFNYKLKNESNNIKVGFPIVSLNKVLNKLNELKINYLIVEKDSVYKIVINKKFKNNKYNFYYKNYDNIKIINKRIDELFSYLKTYDIEKIPDLLDKIESLYE